MMAAWQVSLGAKEMLVTTLFRRKKSKQNPIAYFHGVILTALKPESVLRLDPLHGASSSIACGATGFIDKNSSDASLCMADVDRHHVLNCTERSQCSLKSESNGYANVCA